MNQPQFHQPGPANPPTALTPQEMDEFCSTDCIQKHKKKRKAVILLAAIGLPAALITGCTVGVGSSGASASPSATVTVTAEPEIVEVPAADDDGSYDDGYADGKAEAESAAQEAADEENAAKDAEAEQAAQQEAEQEPVIMDGSYEVGSDDPAKIAPGRYKTAQPVADGGLCYADATDYASEEFFSQEVTDSGHTIINVPAEADLFSSSGCGEWVKL